MSAAPARTPSTQRGAAVVEFALVAIVFIVLMLGIVQLGWILFKFNSAVQATRAGARVAAVSTPHSAAILQEMRHFLPELTASDVVIGYHPDRPAARYAQYVTVELSASVPLLDLWPGVLPAIAFPAFTTALPRESLGSG